MEKLRLFYAAAFVAALTGCPGPLPPDMHDSHVDPGDAGHDNDAYVDPMVDAYVPPGDDAGMDPDSSMPAVCADPDYVGVECNLPMGMVYSSTDFACAAAIDNDLWQSDAVGASPEGEVSHIEGGRLLVYLHFADDNAGLNMPGGTRPEFTCGNDGACWLNWMNPGSNYSKCRVTFEAAAGGPGCDLATVDCLIPGSTIPVTNYGYNAGSL